MPLHLEPVDVSVDLKRFGSVLVVSCPVCPPVSLAMQKNSPFIEFFKRGLKTDAFEHYIKEIRERLEQYSVRTGTFSIYAPCPTMCLWTQGQRERLLKRAKDHEAYFVLGCDPARYTAQQALRSTNCQIIPGMQVSELINATVKFQLPMTISLEEKTRVGQGNVRLMILPFFILGTFALASITFAAEQTASNVGPWHGWHGFGFWWLCPLMMIFLFMFFLYAFRRDRRHWRQWMREHPGRWSRYEGNEPPSPESALDILNKRYARGEIDKAEYEDKKMTIAEHGDHKP